MSFKGILDAAKEAEDGRKRDEEKARVMRKQKRIDTASAIAGHIESTIQPIFNLAEKEILASGRRCEVGITVRSDSAYDSDDMFAVAIVLKVDTSTVEHISAYSELSYNGGFDDYSFKNSVYIPFLNKPPQISPAIALSTVTEKSVTEEVEDFLKMIFKLK